MKTAGMAGVSGEFRFIRQHGLGADGRPLSLEDLLLRGADGEWEARDGGTVLEDARAKNKFTKRGLSAMMHRALSGHPGGPYVPTDITSGQTTNPFVAFFMAADDPTAVPTPKDADARVLWNESDSAFDARVPVNPGVTGIGVRAILLSDTTGPDLKRTSIAYPTTNPYREIEYTFFAQANVPTYATGTVTVPAGSSGTLDGAWFTLNDGFGGVITFEFDNNASVAEWDGNPANRVPVRFLVGDTADDVRNKTILAVNDLLDATLYITAATGGSGIVALTHDKGGAIGAKTVLSSGAPLSVSGMTGGSALETGDGEIDNLPFKAVGLSAGIQCGDGEASNLIGVRSVVGLPPVFQGVCDRVYVHEGTGLHKYVAAETLGGVAAAGYYQSTQEDETIRAVSADAADQIWAATKRVRMRNGAFSPSDVGRGLTIAGSGAGNNGQKRIAAVLTKTDVTVLEAVSNESTGFTATVCNVNDGSGAFDGAVETEPTTGVVNLGERKWRSANSSGPHDLGRVWTADMAVHGIRVICPAGVPKSYCLNTFKVQWLDPSKAGGDVAALEPANAAHWTDVGTEVDFTASGQAGNIFGGAERGYEFRFNAPKTTRGIKITSCQAFDNTKAVEVAEFYIFTELPAITITAGVDDVVRLATSGTPTGPGVPGAVGTYRSFSIGSVTTSGDLTQNDVTTLANALNKVLRGYELEALRSTFGFLWIRATVAGNKAQLDKGSTASGGTANAKLGLSTAEQQRVGLTQTIRKFAGDALTIIYRANISGDLPVSS